MSNCTEMLRVHGTLIARILMGGFFLLLGIGKLMNGGEMVTGMIEGTGLPAAALLGWIVIIIEIVGGAAIIVGMKTSKAALVLLILTLLATVLIHELSLEDMATMRNVAIIGGLLYIAAYGPGDGWSLARGKSSPMPSTPSGDMQ